MPDREESSVSRPTLKLRDACPRAFHLVWVVVVVLTVWGMCMMLSVSTAAALTLPEADKFLYVRQQGITAII
ncbi:MAG: hypothetical protein H5T84_00580, partial [Thermoleophilia bacterium]|nr:hypothetical protein [Thermoleophilia bacterium]